MLDDISDQSHNSSNKSNTNNTTTTNSIQGHNEEFTIRVLTLNCWGLWLGAKRRHQRMTGIVNYLRKNNCDIVFLQEVWVTSDFDIIRNGTKDIYRFAHLFRSGSVLGSSGIVILCKWIPKVIHFEPYSLNGSPFYPWHGDWFAGKGIAYTRVDFDGLSLHLFSTHTHAYYKENEPIHDQYSVHRICQSYQLARFITFISDTACNRKSNGKDLLIVAGDMNTTSSELPYRILTTMAGLTDCFKVSRNNNMSSNIIHKHKIMTYKQKFQFSDNSDSVSFCPSQTGANGLSLIRSKLGDNFLLDAADECSSRIAQFFDSDTEDEDITYCHPRNSFTPGTVDYKAPSLQSLTTSQQDSSASKNNSCAVEGSSKDSRSSLHVKQRQQNSTRTKKTKKSAMKRIDFILCRLLTHGHCVVDRIVEESIDTSLDCSLSDHEPVKVELKISDFSHDLIEKNHIVSRDSSLQSNNKQNLSEYIRPLASVVESKVSLKDASQLEETTNQWVPEEVPVNLSYHGGNIKVMEETQETLMQYYQYNRSSKTQLFYVVLFMFIITLPTTTYYTIENELMPISTIVFMWFASSFLFAIGLLMGFLSYRFEQGAIEAILTDITCKIAVAKDHH